MEQVILYIQDSGVPAVISPVQAFAEVYGVHAIAVKDVPEGKPFRIMEASDLPAGPQEEWEIDPATLTDGVGGAGNEFPPLPESEEDDDPAAE